mmetsp:Transcript_27839/g.31955  ORF Transcript_27839/g.31955 Transcript_27839/m.31955 type:complete len:643 (+) Transcript_27839:330-2258(+)
MTVINDDKNKPNEERKDEPVSTRVSVFVRVRPLTPSEEAAGSTILEGLTTTSSPKESDGNAVALASRSSIDGFTSVLGQEANNRNVFEICFSERLSTVIRGGTASLFCYGYTGGGKTHTAVGYGKERGLFFLAAEKLLDDLSIMQETTTDVVEDDKKDEHEDDKKLFLRATACEIYLDNVFDILGTNKEPCTIRIDNDGQLAITREAKSEQLEGFANTDGEHAALVTQAPGLRSVPIHKPQDLDHVNQSCIAQRACGTSTANHVSSRSHAILRLEVVSNATNQVRNRLQRLHAELPALKNVRDNAQTSLFHADCLGYIRVLRRTDLQLENELHPSDLIINHITEAQKIALKDVQYGNIAYTLEEWSDRLNLSSLKVTYVKQMQKYTTLAERKAVIEKKEEELSNIKVLVAKKEKEISEVTNELQSLTMSGPAALGGSMLLIDLAGADYDHRGGKAQKESTAINKSLLALKECLRAVSSNNDSASSSDLCTQRPPFRNSKLTRILEDSLSPSKNSSRRNKESACVMLVNVSPASHLKSGTVNALRYGQMFSVGKNDKNRSSSTFTSLDKLKKNNETNKGESNFAEKAILKELRRIYEEYVPKKSEEETEAILTKFKGRERWLLEKVKNKYGVTKREELSVIFV